MQTNSEAIQIDNATGKYKARTDYPDFPAAYKPNINIVEIHDERGLLVKIERMQITLQNNRPANFIAQLICWYFDGNKAENLAYVHTEHKVLINRISQLYCLSDLAETLNIGAAA